MHRSIRLDDIQPFHVMELLRRARELEAQGRDIIHMEVGEPDFATPQPVIDAATRFLAGGDVHYTPALGLRGADPLGHLRQRAAQVVLHRVGRDVRSQELQRARAADHKLGRPQVLQRRGTEAGNAIVQHSNDAAFVDHGSHFHVSLPPAQSCDRQSRRPAPAIQIDRGSACAGSG